MSAKHTPGPWRWELNEQGKSVALVGGKPQYDKIVMDFERYGMQHAAPRFNDCIAGNQFNIMERCDKYATTVKGREHHANWFKDLTHPDARIIAAAPELFEALQSMEMALIGYVHQNDVTKAALDKCRAAIAKATGEDK